MNCAHHYHADERGWSCCHCPGRISKRNTPPENREGLPCARDRSWLGPNATALSTPVRVSQMPAGARLMRRLPATVRGRTS